ncbi:MAG: hypothetical protein SFV15_03065 [Polyangiaceae bacterium]|nr:hypothetical protein [Polyangiaceae bacterium]
MALELQSLKAERDKLKEALRQIEADQRRVETELKAIRQREIQTKREIEALSTLIDLGESRDEEPTSATPAKKTKKVQA